MCGIAGKIEKGVSAGKLKNTIERMNDAQSRRGPDDRGVWVDEKAGLTFGHTRLSILDLSSAGRQPMLCPKLAITFNGEIYNFKELREELKKGGHVFKTNTDTEVILSAYAEWGVESFSKLRGMFAFGLWDGEKRKLYLVKDRYGIKPLYYYSDKGKLIFASTVKAIRASGLVPEKNNTKAMIGFLLFGSVPLPHTTLENVYGLEAGHYLEIDTDLSVRKIKYYEPLDFFHGQKVASRQTLIPDARQLLEEAVKAHLISDAPLGIFLSGGIDSSALAILASKARMAPTLQRSNVTTLSIVFDEAEYSEQKYQQHIAKQIKSNHHEYKITKEDFERALPDVWSAMDQPSIDGVNTYFVAKAAKDAGLKAVLSGLGADEIFMGYPSFKRVAMLRHIQALPTFCKLPLALGGVLGGRYGKLGHLRYEGALRLYLAIRGLFMPSEVSGMLGIPEREVNDFIDELSILYRLDNPTLQQLQPLNILSYLELKFYLQNQLLKDSDFMAMHHGVEVRVPFLDHPLVEYVSALPARAKLTKRPKQLLIDAVADLPETIYNRPKMGFTFPFQRWLSQLSTVNGQVYAVKGHQHWSRHWAKAVVKNFHGVRT